MNVPLSFKKAVKIAIAIPLKLIHQLTCNNVSQLNPNETTKKKIIVIGPAQSSLSYLSGPAIDAFDLIVRVNKSYLTLSGKEEYLGSRTDLLFHCFNEDPITGGGIIDPDLLKAQKNKFIIYPYAEHELERKFYYLAIKHKNHLFSRIPDFFYKELKKNIGNYIPTTGLQSLNYLMNQDFEELHITGFTFFKTPYVADYRDSHRSAEKAYSLATSKGSHHPDNELKYFLLKLKECRAKGQNVYLDEALSNIISNISPVN